MPRATWNEGIFAKKALAAPNLLKSLSPDDKSSGHERCPQASYSFGII